MARFSVKGKMVAGIVGVIVILVSCDTASLGACLISPVPSNFRFYGVRVSTIY